MTKVKLDSVGLFSPARPGGRRQLSAPQKNAQPHETSNPKEGDRPCAA